ncbi:MAG: GNAT family N-acetyltransferase [Anaerolineales bacterium]|jgi:CelD/BcsL family acetyltransferase involved in cellulose biosynthesis|nr:GNAT family N-acetyltransferase [Anaerolineales bacterium]
MDYTLLNDFSQLQAHEWNALLKESISDTPFLRHEYQRLWWEHRGGGEWKNAQLILVSAREGDRLVGIAPLFIAEYEGQPALLLNGSIEISDYLDLIVRKDDHAQFVTGLLDFLASSLAGNWSKLDWYNLPDDSPTLAALKAESEKRGWAHLEEMYRPTPRIALNGNFEDYLANIEKKQRHEIRRKMRRAAESDLNVRFVIVDQSADIEPELNAFFDLMVQDSNKATFLHPAMREQMTAFLRAAHEGGYLWLGFLEISGVKTAASLNFDYNGKFWGYNSGVSRAHMELSPGWVLMANTIQWCCENNRHEFDFMRGDEDYKYRLGGVNRFVMRARLILK